MERRSNLVFGGNSKLNVKKKDKVSLEDRQTWATYVKEMQDVYDEDADITVIAISGGRLNLLEAEKMLREKGIKCNIFHLLWLKPFNPPEVMLESLKRTNIGLVIDSDFEITGASRSIAYELMHLTGASVHALGLEDRVCGVAERLENITPSPQKITATIETLLQPNKK